MRPTFLTPCLALLLKFLNYLQIFTGVSVVLYAVWSLNWWNRHAVDLDRHHLPWLVSALLGFGVLVCLIAFMGHISAGTGYVSCLCFYAALITVLILSEAAIVGDVVFNKHWEEDLPRDDTGELRRLRDFIKDNVDICTWVAVTAVVIQALSLVLAMILRTMLLKSRVDNDNNEEIPVSRKPLLNPHADASSSLDKVTQNGTWSSRILQKFGLRSSPTSECIA
ncbi:tetraspanin-18-like [Typha angustifolia]|uniref:tetraspanin-18-like n=1 Tax=Typha angustifolia TaxID=59011 RepID=UPI003C2FAABB